MSRLMYVALSSLAAFVAATLILFLESDDLGLSVLFGLGFGLLALVMFATDGTHKADDGR